LKLNRKLKGFKKRAKRVGTWREAKEKKRRLERRKQAAKEAWLQNQREKDNQKERQLAYH
jgi:hypothetical protein